MYFQSFHYAKFMKVARRCAEEAYLRIVRSDMESDTIGILRAGDVDWHQILTDLGPFDSA